MPLTPIIFILLAVGAAALLVPSWTLEFIWMGGLALLWVITSDWKPQARRPAADKEEQALQEKAPEADHVRPLDGLVEAEDLDDLARLDGEMPADDATQKQQR